MEQSNEESTQFVPQEEMSTPQQPEQPTPSAPQMPSEPIADPMPFAPQMPSAPPTDQIPPVPPVPEQPVYGQPTYQQPFIPAQEQPIYGQPMYQQPFPPAKKKKNTLKIVLPIVIVLLIAAAVAVYFLFFNGTPIDEIELDDSALTLKIGDEYTFDYGITPDDATELELTWKSDDESVATVKDGKVTAVAEGSCTITVIAESGAQDTCEITVKPPISEEDERLVGRWEVVMTYFDGDLQTFSNDSTYLLLDEDMTGVFHLGDSVYNITSWGFQQSTDGSDLYTVVMENLGTVGFAYATDSSNALYGNLVLILDSENMLILER